MPLFSRRLGPRSMHKIRLTKLCKNFHVHATRRVRFFLAGLQWEHWLFELREIRSILNLFCMFFSRSVFCNPDWLASFHYYLFVWQLIICWPRRLQAEHHIPVYDGFSYPVRSSFVTYPSISTGTRPPPACCHSVFSILMLWSALHDSCENVRTCTEAYTHTRLSVYPHARLPELKAFQFASNVR